MRRALEPLRLSTNLPIVVSPAAERAALDAGAVFDLDLTVATRAANVLNLILDQAGGETSPGACGTTRVLVTTKEAVLADEVRLRMYDITPLTVGLTSFSGPEIGRLAVSGDDSEGRFGGSERAQPRFDADQLLNLVRDNVAPGTWDGGVASIDVYGGRLVVRHTPEVHRQIRRLLATLGA